MAKYKSNQSLLNKWTNMSLMDLRKECSRIRKRIYALQKEYENGKNRKRRKEKNNRRMGKEPCA